MPTTFSFGAKSAPDKANTDTTKKEAAPSKPFVFASSSTSSSTGFNFSMSSNLKSGLDQKLKLVSAGADSVNVAKKDEGKSKVTPGTRELEVLKPFPPFRAIVICSLICFCHKS